MTMYQAAAVQAENLMRPKWVLALGGRNLNLPEICRLTVSEMKELLTCESLSGFLWP